MQYIPKRFPFIIFIKLFDQSDITLGWAGVKLFKTILGGRIDIVLKFLRLKLIQW